MPTSSLILASASPRRKELLERVGFSLRIVTTDIDEVPLPGEMPLDYTKRLAREKGLAAMRRLMATAYPEDQPGRRGFVTGNIPARAAGEEPSRWILGADTVVAIDDVLLGKPTDEHEAREMIARLSGREHRVITGFSLVDLRRNKEGIQAVTTFVRFKRLTRAEIDNYIGMGESMDKAGAYAVQGIGAYLVEEIRGSYTNVVGLPLCQVIEMMHEMGAGEILPV